MNCESKAWFESYQTFLRRRRLALPICQCCNKHHWYPKSVCPHCRHGDWAWQEISGNATLFTWTRVHQSFTPEIRAPYTVVIVQPTEDSAVRFVSNLHPDCDDRNLLVGMTLRAVFDDACTERDMPLPLFVPE